MPGVTFKVHSLFGFSPCTLPTSKIHLAWSLSEVTKEVEGDNDLLSLWGKANSLIVATPAILLFSLHRELGRRWSSGLTGPAISCLQFQQAQCVDSSAVVHVLFHFLQKHKFCAWTIIKRKLYKTFTHQRETEEPYTVLAGSGGGKRCAELSGSFNATS